MRRAICFLVAAAMFGAGGFLLAELFLFAERIKVIVVLAGATLAALGGYWLWVDFVSGWLGHRHPEAVE